jgi:hypothetical protein
MQAVVRNVFAALSMSCLLVGCKGAISSPVPLITLANASYPFQTTVEIQAQTLNEDHIWENTEGKARLTLVGRSYRVTDPDQATPSSDTYLFKQIKDNSMIVQASNGEEWAYGLIVHADRYYLFTFNLENQNCTSLSAAEQGQFHMALKDDECSVSSLEDLAGLLTLLRQKYPYPTSAFSLR